MYYWYIDKNTKWFKSQKYMYIYLHPAKKKNTQEYLQIMYNYVDL